MCTGGPAIIQIKITGTPQTRGEATILMVWYKIHRLCTLNYWVYNPLMVSQFGLRFFLSVHFSLKGLKSFPRKYFFMGWAISSFVKDIDFGQSKSY